MMTAEAIQTSSSVLSWKPEANLPHLLLSLHLLLPGRVDGIHHPLDGEVGDSAEDGEAEEQADDLVPAQRAGDVVSWNLPQYHRGQRRETLAG